MTGRRRGSGRSLLERTTEKLRDAVERVAYAERATGAGGLLQGLDPRAKLAGLFALVMAATMARTPAGILAVLAVALVLAGCSRVPIGRLASHAWVPALIFSGAIALPAFVLTPGDALFRVPALGWPVTSQGVSAAAYLVLRVETAVTLASMLVLTTPWAHLLKALRSFGVPLVFVVILGMSFRYVLLLLETAHDLFEARRSRLVGELKGADTRRMAAATAGVLMGKTLHLAGEVHLAMVARGFRGELYLLEEFRMRRRDWGALTALGLLAAAAVWAGR